MVINLPGDTFVVGQKWSTGLVHAFMKPAYKFFETSPFHQCFWDMNILWEFLCERVNRKVLIFLNLDYYLLGFRWFIANAKFYFSEDNPTGNEYFWLLSSFS